MERAYLRERTPQEGRAEWSGEERGGYLLVTVHELLGPASPRVES